MYRWARAVLALAVACACAQVRASGNLLPRANSEALGMADANVALAAGPAAQFINPANIADTATADWEAGALTGRIRTTFTRHTPAGGAAAGDFAARTGHPFVPFAATVHPQPGGWVLGFAVESPFGLGVEWPDHVWDLPFGADLAHKADLSVLRVGPAAARRVGERASVGVRVFSQHVRALEESDLTTVEGKGNTVGAQLGVRWRAPDFIAGAAFTTRTHTEIKGSQRNVHPLLAATLIEGEGRADILVPPRLQAGLALRIHSDVWWETDLDWLGWSYVDELTIYQSDGTVINAGKNARHYRDTLSVRTGFQWRRSARRVVLAGLGYDPTPIPERDASPVISMLRKTRVAVGLLQQLTGGLRLGIAYQYIRGHSRRINETDQDIFAGSDTNLFEGTYASRSHAVSLSVSGAW